MKRGLVKMRKKVEILFGTSDKKLQRLVNNFLSNHKDEKPRVVNYTVTSRRDGGLQFHCMIEYSVI